LISAMSILGAMGGLRGTRGIASLGPGLAGE
jgi:hypothetical protein